MVSIENRIIMELQTIQNKIYEVRGQKVLLDFDLALLYGTETKKLKQAVRRNGDRYPSDFMFELTKEEYNTLRSQIVTLETRGRGAYSKYNPFAFTEQGIAMLASVLRSSQAIEVNIQIIRAFVFLRKYALSHTELTQKLKELEAKYDKQFTDVFEAINFLLQKNKEQPKQPARKRIGFNTEETD